jgi:hypothetical protein
MRIKVLKRLRLIRMPIRHMIFASVSAVNRYEILMSLVLFAELCTQIIEEGVNNGDDDECEEH